MGGSSGIFLSYPCLITYTLMVLKWLLKFQLLQTHSREYEKVREVGERQARSPTFQVCFQLPCAMTSAFSHLPPLVESDYIFKFI